MRPADGLGRVRLYYLLTNGALGIYLPFINVFFESERGLSGWQMGVLAAVGPTLALLAAPAWGAAADVSGSRLAVLRWALVGTAAGALLIGLPALFVPLLLAVGFFSLFQVAIIPLGDGVITAAAAERGVAYGGLRLWGSIGFALAGLIFGQLVHRLGLGSIFPGVALLMLLALPVMWRMVPHEPPPPKKEKGSQWLALLRDRPLALFLLVVGLAAIGITVGYIFLYVFLGSLGAGGGLMGLVSAVGSLVEVPFMFWSGRLIRKRGAPPVFALGMGLYALCWGLYAFLQAPVLAPLIQVLAGAGMGLLWPAGVIYVAQRAPAGRDATAQSLLAAVMSGVAPLLGSQLAGVVFDAAGPRTVLLVAAGTIAAGLVLFAAVNRRLGTKLDAQSSDC